MLQYPLQHCAEVLLLGMSHINVLKPLFLYLYHTLDTSSFDLSSVKFSVLIDNLDYLLQTAYNLLQHELSATVFPMILKNGTGSSGIINHLWHVNTNLVLRGIVEAHKSDLDVITKTLDICQEIKVSSEESSRSYQLQFL